MWEERMLKVRRRTHLAALLFAGALIGCASYQEYSSPIQGAPTAELHMRRETGEPNGPPGAPAHWFHIYDNPSCERTPSSGLMGTVSWDTHSSFDKSIGAGSPMFLRVGSRYVTAGGAGGALYTRNECTSFASFTPLQNHSYTVWQRGADCSVVVTDDATQQAPPDFGYLPVPQACRDFKH